MEQWYLDESCTNNAFTAAAVHLAVMGGRKENVTLQCSLVHEVIKSLIVICKCGTISNDQQGNKCKVVDKFRLHSSLETKYLYLLIYLGCGMG